MRLEQLRRHWEAFGRSDPFWAVLTTVQGTDGRWDRERFFASGLDEVDEVMGLVAELGIDLGRGAAMDFGCGVGRYTQALCRHFDVVYGVDIAASMLDLARELNRHGERCRYVLNTSGDLGHFEDASLDLVHSRLVLQHIEPQYSLGYLREFARVLRPGGVAVFQVPSHYDEARVLRLHLGPAACVAAIDVLEAPARLRGGEAARVRAAVTNRGDTAWPGPATTGSGATSVRLGNHWVDRRGRVIVNDDGRAPIPHDLAPGASAEIELTVTAPDRPGRHRLELDVVQEGVRWFGQAGSLVATADVAVRPSPLGTARRLLRRVAPRRAGFVPVMESHGLSQDQVRAALGEVGAEVVRVDADDVAGLGWVSYRYVARRSG